MDEQRPSTDKHLLRQFLQTHDVLCPLCQYNLRGLDADRCPECGRGLELSIRVSEHVYRAWIVAFGFSAFSAPLGVFFIIAALMGESDHWSAYEWAMGLAASILLLNMIYLIVARKRILRAQVTIKRFIAIASVVGAAVFWSTVLLSLLGMR